MEKYTKLFVDIFGVSESEAKSLKYQDVDAWDSVGHMGLVAALEQDFGVTLDTDDIIDFSSFEKGIEILAKYGINLDSK
ncbi:acyl carrier protein [Helicobacter saguini]|uniref:Acyl carrier protein n=1 Tax=Helicobacter saguini TaxID=1548018 RepID=A0A347VVD3_9HELI|nr:phosphopantetheine-binding protein [Helicobacter saguini]MWV62476.1 acyl carrier protein [Helicobacter saguini]MWV66851.1 acyl carrier protein [Helicobacter saguini]MWV69200.1 acyl carrier protein [Helicobacter saguini]MWV71245.1 acyl carrier protein [Helicobacter saguini]TLD94237.1 acyl carrier protein [Helicobacter saguini]